MSALLVALGAALGAALRFTAGHIHDRPAFAWGTLGANLTGSFVLGLVTAAGLGPTALALLGTGFCGGLTTYSSFAVQTRTRAVERGGRAGATYAAVTLLGALVVCAAGAWLGARVVA